MFDDIKDAIINFISHRIFVIAVVAVGLFSILAYRLFTLQIVNGQEHLDNFTLKSEKTIVSNGARGNIYDCNGKLLAYNRLTYSLTFEEDSSLISKAQQENTTVTALKNEIIYKIIKILEKNGDSIVNSFNITLENGEFTYTVSDSAKDQFLKEVYCAKSVDKLTKKQRNSTAKEVFEYLRYGDKKTKMFDVDKSYSNEDALKIVAVRYLLFMNRYNQYVPVTIAMDLSQESVAAIEENSSELPGAAVKDDSVREYADSEYFSSILGYTGIVSEDEKESLNADKNRKIKYTGNEIVGKSGIEQEFENQLQGTKGKKKVLVNNVGKIIQEEKKGKTEAKSGNDVYLTIDSDLQKYCSNVLERRLAGILLAHIQNRHINEKEKSDYIGFDEVLYAFFDNNVINVHHLNSKKAKSSEKKIADDISLSKKNIISALERELKSTKTAQKNLSEANKEYMVYIYNMLFDNGIMTRSEIDSADATLKSWKDENISLAKFFEYAIKKTWIKSSKLDIHNDYYDTDEIYEALISYIKKELKKSEKFEKLVIKYQIQEGKLSANDICMILYEQNVLDNNNGEDKDYKALKNGSINAYSFVMKKIKKMQITPSMLALSPCTGSIVITDVKTGTTKALVSYPGYDNNRLANNLDNNYYTSLLKQEKTTPLYNKATMSRTAPGSTFKPLSAITGLSENVISSSEILGCSGIYNKISPSPKCWVYPSSHGKVDVTEAIEKSCNCYFYEVGYRLGQNSSGTLDAKLGLSKLKKYASKFGFTKLSGIELPETEPHFSTEDCVRSAIGQGSHSFAPVQIARYATTLANNGSCFNLSIINKIMDNQGNVIKEHKPDIINKVKLSDEIWNDVHTGMYDVVNGKAEGFKELYEKLPIKVAGKTGTAQEQEHTANHALFISYAPYENPEIAVTVVVPNGYSSANAVDIAHDVYAYYYRNMKKSSDDDKKNKDKKNTETSSTSEETTTENNETTENPNEALMPSRQGSHVD